MKSYDIAVDVTATYVIQGIQANSLEEAKAIAKMFAKQDGPPELGPKWELDSWNITETFGFEKEE